MSWPFFFFFFNICDCQYAGSWLPECLLNWNTCLICRCKFHSLLIFNENNAITLLCTVLNVSCSTIQSMKPIQTFACNVSFLAQVKPCKLKLLPVIVALALRTTPVGLWAFVHQAETLKARLCTSAADAKGSAVHQWRRNGLVSDAKGYPACLDKPDGAWQECCCTMDMNENCSSLMNSIKSWLLVIFKLQHCKAERL